jgi:tRNA(fMet)-specific endonuclease VapC
VRRIILDTNAYTQLLSGNGQILEIVASAETVFMSIFVIGELHAGFYGGSKEKDNRETLNRFLSKPSVKILNATSDTAEIFGFVKNNLKKAGSPIPINDVWIAAHGIETGSIVITFDDHFSKVAGLRVFYNIK